MDRPRRGFPPPAVCRSCPVKDRGIQLRSTCDDCEGRPPHGQLTLSPGTPLCLEEEPAEHVYAVVDGFLRETRTLPDGRAQALRLIEPGELAGAEALGAPRYHATVEAATTAVVCRVPVAAALETVRTRSEQAVALMGELVGELGAVRESLVWVGSLSAEDRVLAALTKLSRGTPRGSFFRLPVSRRELSELLGLAYETVSRAVQSLARRGVIQVRGRWIAIQ